MATLNYHIIERTAKLGKFKDKKVYSALPVLHGQVSFGEFCREVADGSTVDEADVKAVLSRLNVVIERNLRRGFSVDCGELGTFRPSFGSKQVEREEDFKTELITPPRVVFTPRKGFKNALRGVGFERAYPKSVHIGSKPGGVGGSESGRSDTHGSGEGHSL